MINENGVSRSSTILAGGKAHHSAEPRPVKGSGFRVPLNRKRNRGLGIIQCRIWLFAIRGGVDIAPSIQRMRKRVTTREELPSHYQTDSTKTVESQTRVHKE